MKIWKVYGLLGLLGFPLFIWNASIALGWVVGQCVMVLLTLARERFYDILLSSSKFSAAQYGGYIIFTVGLLSAPLIISFLYQEVLNPYAVFAAYFLDRTLHFVLNLFVKEEPHAN